MKNKMAKKLNPIISKAANPKLNSNIKELDNEAEKEKEMLAFIRRKQEEKYLRINNKINAFMLSLQKEENCELIIGYPNNIQPQILIKLL
jgi:hypothetical protein